MSGKKPINSTSNQPGLFESEEIPIDSRNLSDNAVMYCDGASSGNPGKSGVGVVIKFSDNDAGLRGKKEDCRISEYIGITTNNVAEYSALIKGLETAKSLGIRKIRIFLDSELLVRQINGIYKVKSRNLISLWNKANNILKTFDSYKISHVRREMNKEADSLAREAVKEPGKK